MNSESRRKVEAVKYVYGSDLDRLETNVNKMLAEDFSLYGDAFRQGDGIIQTMVKYKVMTEFKRRIMVNFHDFDEGKEKRIVVEAINAQEAIKIINNSYENCEIIGAYEI